MKHTSQKKWGFSQIGAVILKVITPIDPEPIGSLIRQALQQAESYGVVQTDITQTVAEARGKR